MQFSDWLKNTNYDRRHFCASNVALIKVDHLQTLKMPSYFAFTVNLTLLWCWQNAHT